MTGHRFRIDSLEFRRKLSRETLKNWILDLGISWKVTWRQNAFKMILGGPSCLQTDPWWSMVPPKIKIKTIEFQLMGRDPTIGIMRTYEASWVLMMMPHEYSWEYSWCIRSTHDASWVLMMHHEHSWCIMNTYDEFIVGGTVDHQGSVWRQLGPPRTIVEIFCLQVYQ